MRKRESVFATAQVNGFRLLSFPSGEARKTLSREDMTQRACFSDARQENCQAVLPFLCVKRRRAIKIVRVTHKLPQRTNP